MHCVLSLTILFAFAVTTLVIALATFRVDNAIALARFSLWTNVLFLWPVVRALSLGGASEAVVFVITLVVSAFHHGCAADALVRQSLAVDTYLVVAASLLTSVVAAASFAVARIRLLATTPARARTDIASRHRSLLYAIVVAVSLVAAVSLSLFSLAVGAAARGALDGCAYPTSAPDYADVIAPRLASLWGVIDYVTAFSAIIVVLVYFCQPRHRYELGAFWLLAVLVLVVGAYVEAALVSPTTLFAIVGAAGFVLVLGRVLACWAMPRDQCGALVRRYRWADALAGAAIGGVAIFIFVDFNNAALHGWWHVAAALALYLIVESLYRDDFAVDVAASMSYENTSLVRDRQLKKTP